MKVLYIVNVPAPYMVSYFNELGKLCDLTVLFEKSTSTERDKSWKEYTFPHFKGIILGGLSTDVDMAFCPQVIKYLKKGAYDYILCTSMATPTGILAIEYMKLRKIPFYLESEGGFAKDGKGLKEKFKRHLMTGATGYFSTTPVGDEYFMAYGAPKDKIYKYPFTSLYERDLLPAPVPAEERRSLRQKLGIGEGKMLVSVGQFIPRKGFDILIHAAAQLSKDMGVYIIGGIPTPEYEELKETCNASNVHFVGFLSKDALAEYYKAADLFVLQTREDTWGLVINEAMAYGLPVITTDQCVAGHELVSTDNGALLPVEAPDLLAKTIQEILADEPKRQQMAQRSLEKIQPFTFENNARVHMQFFEEHQ